MEQNLPIITKKLWNMVRLAFFILRKRISKKKTLLDINLFVKRGKIASKVALNNNHHHVSASQGGVGAFSGNLQSGGATTNNNSEDNNDHHYYLMSTPKFKDEYEYEAVNEVLDSMMSTKHAVIKQRELSITTNDSPFELEKENQQVDAAADAFIKRFYSQLMMQDS